MGGIRGEHDLQRQTGGSLVGMGLSMWRADKVGEACSQGDDLEEGGSVRTWWVRPELHAPISEIISAKLWDLDLDLAGTM